MNIKKCSNIITGTNGMNRNFGKGGGDWNYKRKNHTVKLSVYSSVVAISRQKTLTKRERFTAVFVKIQLLWVA
jgi:hypothetical protein